MDNSPSSQNIFPDALTSIDGAYTLSNTNEADALMIKQFEQTLAEVALAIASRNMGTMQ